MHQQLSIEPPAGIGELLPSTAQLIAGLSNELVVIESGAPLYRAAYSPLGIVPDRVARAYRFGPPSALVGPDGVMPFWWLYMAFEPDTTVWEARFCQNDLTRPGTFYIDRDAECHGVIATLRFPRPLRLWNLNGEASSRLGIFDMLSSPDYQWCQWFGARVHDALKMCSPASRPDGVVYPSRRYRGQAAIILSSSALESMRTDVQREHVRFVEHAAYRRLLDDPLRVPPPLATG
ncbi:MULTISPECIES: RES family NAD+ phosphorylase [unclassified Burkholderia]|uniref:RES family NAD+ phosphorylase n=1 Tax=unclassified Burkholderia TaxID=2613784 RepID=UPI00214F7235|nr:MULTISPECIES: RES family NAD+ phosphorylase [unclassified Burkholderia]MCR4469789.1 RES family NAD+ phosphorylase [Burkholderia sp. SCN-KJ]